jgi:Mrp family chromosome partitioning ATPase/capsular polysaccharide biosynthesis protein
MQNESGATTARLGDYLVVLRRHWLVVLLCLVVGVAGSLAYLLWAPKEYRSQTSVLVTAMETDSTIDRNSAINLDTEAQLVTSTETVARAAEALGLPAGTVADHVSVSVPPNTEILDITYTGGTAAAAQKGSQAFAKAYLEGRTASGTRVLESQAATLQDRIDAVQEQLDATLKAAADPKADSSAKDRAEAEASRLSQQLSTLGSNMNRLKTETLTPGRIITEPRLPSSPSNPDPLPTLAAGVLLGLLLGIGLAALQYRRDDVVRDHADLIRRTSLPLAAELTTPLHSGEIVVVKPLSPDGRGYARLRNLVTTSLEETGRRVVVVAGVRRGGGPVAVNLAASLARSGEAVALLCGDVFGPTPAALFDRTAPGLAEVLTGEVTLESAIRTMDGVPNLRVLTPGLDPDRADGLLQTKGARTLVDDLLRTVSYVVIEAPATTDGPDAQTLAGVAELAVLVVEAGQSGARDAADARAQVESMHTAVLGAVIVRYEGDGARKAEPDARGAATTAPKSAAPEVAPVETAPVETAPVEASPADARDEAPAPNGRPGTLEPRRPVGPPAR